MTLYAGIDLIKNERKHAGGIKSSGPCRFIK